MARFLRRWVWRKCVVCRQLTRLYPRALVICNRCWTAMCRIDEESRAVPGELREQSVLTLRPAGRPQHHGVPR